MLARISSFAFNGIDAVPVEVQVQIASGLPTLPLALLIEKFGGDHPADLAMMRLRCVGCGDVGRVEHKLMRLCDPGCPKQIR